MNSPWRLKRGMTAAELGKLKIELAKDNIDGINEKINEHQMEILRLREMELKEWTEIVRISNLKEENKNE